MRPGLARWGCRPQAIACMGNSRPRAQPLVARHPQGWLVVGRPQGATASGQPTRGDLRGQGCHQHEQRHWPQEWLPVGKGSRRIRKGGGDDAEGARGVRAILL
ncbi:hypothetical protein GW17_00049914 [Ensete ventricosum]|nr:hypothetical protein GW17_00049914 [Ensete ventricosum]